MNIAQELLKVARLLRGGKFDAPPVMVEDIFQWVLGCKIKTKIRHLGQLNKDDESQLAELKDKDDKKSEAMRDFIMYRYPDNKKLFDQLKAEVRSYPDAEEVFTKTRKGIPINLSGWRYEKNLKGNPAWKKFKKKKLPVVLKFEPFGGDVEAAYLVNQWKMELTVGDDIPLDSGSRRRMERRLRGSIAHELRHFGQAIFSLVVGDGGMPSRKIRDRGVRQVQQDQQKQFTTNEMLLKHVLDDKEFYPRIDQAEDDFNEMVEEFDNLELSAAFNYFVANTNQKPHRGVRQNEFFVLLKKHNRGKWKKAVRELAKAVL